MRKKLRLQLVVLFTLLCCIITLAPAEARFLSGGTLVPPPAGLLTLPGSPAAVYAVVQYVGWGGAALREKRASDSAQQDVGFSNGYLDMASSNSFCSGTTCTVVTWYDQSGHSQDSTCSTACPVLRASNAVFGIQPITFLPTSGNAAAAFLILPNTLAFSRQSYGAYAAVAVGGGLFNSIGLLGLGTDTSSAFNDLTLMYDNNGGKIRWFDTTFNAASYPQVSQASTLSVASNSTTSTVRVNGIQTTHAAATGITLTGGFIGRGSWFQSGVYQAPFALSEFFALALYSAPLSTAQSQTVEATYAQLFSAVLTPQKQILFQGDSITAQYSNALFISGFMRQCTAGLSLRVGTYNTGVTGAPMQTIYNNRAQDIAHYNAALATNVVHIFAGTNDIQNRASGTIVGYGTMVFNSYLVPYIQAMQAAGFNSVVVGTMLPRNWTGSATDIAQRNTERDAYNTLIIANAATYNYTVADYGAIAALSNPSDSSEYVDGIHPTILGASQMAPVCIAAINPTTAWDLNSWKTYAANDNSGK